jgi:hypothetical protein
MKNPIQLFKKPKEIVMSLVTLSVTGTFCFLAVAGKITPQDLKEILMFVLGGYFGGKMALSGANGNGTQPPRGEQ